MIPYASFVAGGSGEEVTKVSVKLIRHSGFWIRWPALSTDTEITLEESRFYEEAKREEWTPARPRELKFRRVKDTNEFLEI